MTSHTNRRGRKPISNNQKDYILRKLRPYLNQGLTVNKACYEARIPKSTVYDLLAEDIEFAENIAREKNYLLKTTTGILFNLLMNIAAKISAKETLRPDEIRFVWKFVTTSAATKYAFTEKDEATDYELMIKTSQTEESSTERIRRIVNDRINGLN